MLALSALECIIRYCERLCTGGRQGGASERSSWETGYILGKPGRSDMIYLSQTFSQAACNMRRLAGWSENSSPQLREGAVQ
jgi:hypothetical protein